jgi:hypothetical protein
MMPTDHDTPLPDPPHPRQAGARVTVSDVIDRWEGYGHGYYNIHPSSSLPCSVCNLIRDLRSLSPAPPP